MTENGLAQLGFRVSRFVSVAGVLLLLWVSPVNAVGVASEYKIQAGFLLHLTSYVYWPKPANERVICVVGEHNFGTFLHELAAVKQLNGRGERLVVNALTAKDSLQDCDVVYVSQDTEDNTRSILSSLDAGVLTASDSNRFIAAGGALEFYLAGSNVRMRAHLGNVRARGLDLSAELLQLLHIVDSQARSAPAAIEGA